MLLKDLQATDMDAVLLADYHIGMHLPYFLLVDKCSVLYRDVKSVGNC